jgi:hypothetical protein
MTDTINDLYHLRFCHFEHSDIVNINITGRLVKADDVKQLSKFKNLETIIIKTDDYFLLAELLKIIHLFDNLYYLSIRFQKEDDCKKYTVTSHDFVNNLTKKEEVTKYNLVEIIDGDYYDIANILFIKELEYCHIIHSEDEKENCKNCKIINIIQNTYSNKCIIRDIKSIQDYGLLNCISPNIQFLTILINNTNFELTNLPLDLKKLIIIYYSTDSPAEFYDKHKQKIKIPFNCKLKLIKNQISTYNKNINDRYLEIKN